MKMGISYIFYIYSGILDTYQGMGRHYQIEWSVNVRLHSLYLHKSMDKLPTAWHKQKKLVQTPNSAVTIWFDDVDPL